MSAFNGLSGAADMPAHGPDDASRAALRAVREQVDALAPDDDEDEDDPLALNPRQDLAAMVAARRREPEWIEPGVIERGRYYQITADSKVGKSLLTYWMLTYWVNGRSAFDPTREMEPVRVLYLDAENGDELADWLRDMDTEVSSLALLDRVNFPQFGNNALDDPYDAAVFLERVQASAPDVVVFDTISRFIGGEENRADTWHALYRNAIVPLRKAGVTVIRLDHTGKDLARGARGSHAKMGDVEVHWVLSRVADGVLALELERARTISHGRQGHKIGIHRVQGPLRHVRAADGKLTLSGRVSAKGRELPDDPKVAELVELLDTHNVAAGIGRDVARRVLADEAPGHPKYSNATWQTAVRFRRERSDHEADNGRRS